MKCCNRLRMIPNQAKRLSILLLSKTMERIIGEKVSVNLNDYVIRTIIRKNTESERARHLVFRGRTL